MLASARIIDHPLTRGACAGCACVLTEPSASNCSLHCSLPRDIHGILIGWGRFELLDSHLAISHGFCIFVPQPLQSGLPSQALNVALETFSFRVFCWKWSTASSLWSRYMFVRTVWMLGRLRSLLLAEMGCNITIQRS